MTLKQISDKLTTMGYRLPEVTAPVGSYVPSVRSGTTVYVSGQLPMQQGKLMVAGRLGEDVTVDAAQEGARICALNCLAAAAQAAGGIENISRVLRVAVFVNSTPGFTEQAKVANGASDLLQTLFGEAGRHVRAAVGVAALPLNAAVEIEMLAECLV